MTTTERLDATEILDTFDDWTPLPEFLRGFPLPPLDADRLPADAWGCFEVIGADGARTWIERATESFDLEGVFAAISGFLGDVERDDLWLDDDQAFAPSQPGTTLHDVGGPASPAALATAGAGPVDADVDDEPEDAAFDPADDEESDDDEEPETELDARFTALRFRTVDEDDSLTGRFLFLVLSESEDPEEDAVDIYTPGLEGPELEGLLRLAQLRFTDTLSWDDPEPARVVSTPLPARSTLGELFAGWSFPAAAEGVRFDSFWALLQAEDDENTEWLDRRGDGLDTDKLVGVLSWRVRGLETFMVAEWDTEEPSLDELGPDEEDDPESTTFDDALAAQLHGVEDDAPPEDTEDEYDDFDEYDDLVEDPSRRDGPLDERLAALECTGLEPGTTPLRAIVVATGTDSDGDSHLYLAYAARDDWDEDTDFFTDFEELGLLRSALRELLR